jgi:prophage regulatory protein
MTEANTSAPTAHRFLRLPAVLERVGVSKSTLQRWIKAGMFPAGVALTATRSTVAWSAAAVDAWIADKLTAGGGTSWGTFAHEVAQAA